MATSLPKKPTVSFDIETFHDEMVVTVGGQGKEEAMRQVQKQLAHGTAYGMGMGTAKSDDILELLPDWMKAQYEPRIHRRPYERKAVAAYRRAIEKLTPEEVRWAEAFRDEMKAKPDFYAKATPERRRWLEKHYTALAKENTKAGQRAGRVVVHRITRALEGEEAKFPKLVELKHRGFSQGSMRGGGPAFQNIARETMQQHAAYRYMFEQMLKEPKL